MRAYTHALRRTQTLSHAHMYTRAEVYTVIDWLNFITQGQRLRHECLSDNLFLKQIKSTKHLYEHEINQGQPTIIINNKKEYESDHSNMGSMLAYTHEKSEI